MAVYNLHSARHGGHVTNTAAAPHFMSSAATGKHADVVWRVRWAPDSLEGYLNFHSVSSDGRVAHWSLVKTVLTSHDILALAFTRPLANLDTERLGGHRMLEGGRCLAFKPDDEVQWSPILTAMYKWTMTAKPYSMVLFTQCIL